MEQLTRRELIKRGVGQAALGWPLFVLSRVADARLNPPQEVAMELQEWEERAEQCSTPDTACFSRAQDLDVDEIPVFLGTLVGGVLIINAGANLHEAANKPFDQQDPPEAL